MEVCGDLGDQGGDCFHTLTKEERVIAKPKWDEERFGQVCVKPQDFADIKSVIEKLCHAYGHCTYEDQKKLDEFFNKVNNVSDDAKATKQ